MIYTSNRTRYNAILKTLKTLPTAECQPVSLQGSAVQIPILQTPKNQSPPDDIFLTFDEYRLDTMAHPQQNHWGKFIIIPSGLFVVGTPKRQLVTPSYLGLWLPAHTTHYYSHATTTRHCTINIVTACCQGLPKHACQIPVSPILSAIVQNFQERAITLASSNEDKRLFNVLLDQIRLTEPASPFLPMSNHKLLAPILGKLERIPNYERTLKEWAARLYTTERTLARYCQRELGMSFIEWRTRLKYITAVKLIGNGASINEAAAELGYKQTSPFITMFKKYAHITPERYRLAVVEAAKFNHTK